MAADPILVIETGSGAAIGRCTPVTGLTVAYGGVSADISAVNASSLTLSDGRTVPAGLPPGVWPKVLRSNLNSVRGPDWPTDTGDVELQGSDATSFGAQTLSKVTYLDGSGTPQSSS